MIEKWKSLRFRIPIMAISGIIIIAFVLLGLFYNAQINVMKHEAGVNNIQFAQLFEKQLELNKKDLSMAMELLVNNNSIVEKFKNRDRAGLVSELLPFFSNKLKPDFNVEQFQFHLPPAISFLRLHKPEKFGDDLSGFRQTVLKVNSEKQPVAGIEVGRGGPGLRIVYPVFSDGEYLGSVEFGGGLENLMTIAKPLNLSYAIGIDSKVFKKVNRFVEKNSDVEKDGIIYCSFSSVEVKPLLNEISDSEELSEFGYKDKNYTASIYPLKDYSGSEVGKIYLFNDITENRAAIISGIWNNILLVLFLTAVILGIFYRVFRNFLLKPLDKILSFAQARKNGDTSAVLEVNENTEFIFLAESLLRMADKIDQQMSYLDSLPAPVMLVDKEFNIEYMNKAGTELLGSSLDKLKHTKCYDSFKTEHCNTENCACFKSMKFDEKFTEETVSRAGGGELPIIYSSAPIKNREGQITGALEYVADVSKIKDIENYLNRSTKNILIEMSKFAEGDLSVYAHSEKNDDDVAKLFAGFNDSVSKIREMIGQLSSVIDDTASSSNQISSSTEEMAAGAQEQNMQAQEVAKAVDEMTQSIIETSRNATKAREMAETAGRIAEEGGVVVRRTLNGINSIANVISETSTTVIKLGESSNQIGEIIQVIEDIADQTNLLALNAAIEAARAGEQGRGFAVVADEVRKLAERTGTATKEIASMIKNIQNEAKVTVNSIAKGNEEMVRGRELASQAGKSLEEIIVHSKDVVDAIIQVAGASEQQSKAAEQISLNIDGISQVTHESSAGIQQIARASENLNNLTLNLQKMVNQFHFKANNINSSKTGKLPLPV